MDYEDAAFDEKVEYTVSYDQMDQLGPRQKEGIEGIATAINSGLGMGAALKEAGRIRLDPEDRFKILCSIYYSKFGGDKSFIIQWNTINMKIPLLKWSRFKNPIGYILGARTINQKNEIDQQRLEFSFNQFQKTLEQENISKEDILRYSRMWVKSLL